MNDQYKLSNAAHPSFLPTICPNSVTATARLSSNGKVTQRPRMNSLRNVVVKPLKSKVVTLSYAGESIIVVKLLSARLAWCYNLTPNGDLAERLHGPS